MGEMMDNRDVYREFFVKEETCMQCKGNGYVVVALNADPLPVDCKQCNNCLLYTSDAADE